MYREALRSALRKMASDRKKMFDRLKSVETSLLSIPESEHQWSVNQVLGHLLVSEMGIEGYIKKKMQSERLGGSTFAAGIRSLLVNMLLKAPVKVKAPAGVGNPSNDASFDALLDEFDQSMSRWNDLLNEIPDKHISKPIFKHPLVGRLTMKGTLSFIENHHLLHYKQIERVLSKVGKK